jgi:hypothetical protein
MRAEQNDTIRELYESHLEKFNGLVVNELSKGVLPRERGVVALAGLSTASVTTLGAFHAEWYSYLAVFIIAAFYGLLLDRRRFETKPTDIDEVPP